MAQTTKGIRTLASARLILSLAGTILMLSGCSVLESNNGSPRAPSTASKQYPQDYDSAMQYGSHTDESSSGTLNFERLSAELQSDFQYIYNKDIADPYLRVLAVSRGHLGLASVVPPVDPSQDLWRRIRAGFQLDLNHSDPRFERQVEWYVGHPEYLDRTIERSRRYIYHIVEELERRKMPMELALLPVVESAFQPFAYSHARASGLWQFIPSTGRMYGLNQNWWYDGRRDVIASTDAALNYLQNLADIFDGDWMLAVASYNAGAGAVMRAIRYNQDRGEPTDFWHLRLPKETSAYVPKLLALAKVVKHPEDFDLVLESLDNEPYFEVVDIGSQIDLAQAAELADIDLEELYHLNPGFNQWATSPIGPHRLLIPKDNADGFKVALAKIPPDKRLKWTRYAVERGDSLRGIAYKFNTTPEVIRQVNRLNNNLIRVGQKLLIPVAHRDAATIASIMPGAARAAIPGESAAPKTSASSSRIEYKVKAGDTLWDVARRYNVNARQLASWNQISANDVLRPGQKLVVWTNRSGGAATASGGGTERKIVRKVGYRVRSGDSLYRIANKFNVSVNDIAKWNSLSSKHSLRPGQKLDLYVDITRTN